MAPTRVLISGASIAGPALAFWLNRQGWECTVVEQAPAFRDGGQNVDVRGAGREVLRRAGLEDAVREATTGEQGTRFIGAEGQTIAEFPAGKSDTDGPTAEVEILRGDLAKIFIDASGPGTQYLYGDRIVGLDDDGTVVRVSFQHAPEREFDLVIAADGVRSSTRRLVFGKEVKVRPLGLEMTYLTIPRTAEDVDWWRWFNAPGGLAVTLRPDRHGTTRASLTSTLPRRNRAAIHAAYRAHPSPEEQRDILREQFGEIGWQAQRLLDELDSGADVYHDSIAQIRAPRWSKGRIAIVGDAAWCATPVSGMGTTLSIVGSYILAGELTKTDDLTAAFAEWERLMRPFVDKAQKLPPGVPQVANPQTALGLAAFQTVLRAAASPLAKRIGAQLVSPPADDIELPEYRHLQG